MPLDRDLRVGLIVMMGDHRQRRGRHDERHQGVRRDGGGERDDEAAVEQDLRQGPARRSGSDRCGRRHLEARQDEPGAEEQGGEDQEGTGEGCVGKDRPCMDRDLRPKYAGDDAAAEHPGDRPRLEGGIGRVRGGEAVLLAEGGCEPHRHHRQTEEEERPEAIAKAPATAPNAPIVAPSTKP